MNALNGIGLCAVRRIELYFASGVYDGRVVYFEAARVDAMEITYGRILRRLRRLYGV